MFKESLLSYSNAYFNYDMQWEPEGYIPINWFPFYFVVHYFDLHHDPILIDMEKFVFNFTHMARDGESVLYAEVPLIRYWNITSSYDFDILGEWAGTVKLELANVTSTVTITLKASADGHFYP